MTSVRSRVVTTFFKRCWILLAILIIIAAVISSLFRALTPWAKQYKVEIEQYFSKLLGEPVNIQTMETGWYWFNPVIKLKDITISNGNNEIIQLKKLLVGISILKSLWHWQIQPGILYIDSLHLSIRQTNDNHWQIDGLEGKGQSQKKLDSALLQSLLVWSLLQQKIIIQNISMQIYWQNGTKLSVKTLNLTIAKYGGLYHMKGTAELTPHPTSLQLLAEMTLDPYNFKNSSGHMFFSAEQLQLSLWQTLFPASYVVIKNGHGDVQLWLDWHIGKIDSIQSLLNIQHVVWQDTAHNNKHTHMLPYFKANLAWKSLKTGWQLMLDHIKLDLDKIVWPENNLIVGYQANNKTYYFYIKHIVLESFLTMISLLPNLPKVVNSILESTPHGELLDAQCHIKAHQIEYLLMKFSKLGWHTFKTIPGIEHLTGVLYWQPSEGRLELDGQKVIIKPSRKPPVTIPVLDAIFNWKELSHGLRITMEHLIVNHPNLLVSADGRLDGITKDSSGQLNLVAQISTNNVLYWLTYLSLEHLKPKLDNWLKHNIKVIKNLVAEIKVNGLLADFPFDAKTTSKQPEQFSVKGHIHGMNLIPAKGWPLIRNLEAFLQVDKRLLNMDIIQADSQGIIAHNGNIRINDIGLDHEILLVHTNIDTNAKQTLAYVESSPLKKRLSLLKIIPMAGMLNLDLRLEVPLYPDNDNVLVLGDMTFKNNAIIIPALHDLELDSLNGSLQFDQTGIIDGHLKANIKDYPITITTKSIRQTTQTPHPAVQISIEGKTSIDILRHALNLPIVPLIHGTLLIKSLLTLTDDPNDLDKLTIMTSLLGVAIDLPIPFGKSITAKAPLIVNINFNPLKAIKIRIDYDKRLSSYLQFSKLSETNEQFQLEYGNIRLGSGKALEQPHKGHEKGLRIIGILPIFEFKQWREILRKLPTFTTSWSMYDILQSIDIKLKKILIGNQNYRDVLLQVVKQTNTEWFITIQQSKEQEIAAQLHYQPKFNYLSGTFSQLSLQKIDFKQISGTNNNQNKSTTLLLKPHDMPNLDLQIDSFKFGKLNLGTATIRTTMRNQTWQLDSCKITAPFYHITAKGEWSEHNQSSPKKTMSSIQANLQINDLAKTLASWEITPSIEAHKGDIQFQGNWPGAFYDFSVAKVSGQMSITFKNGRITHLSPETEEKLGIGKLLSILSLQTIPRRLTLDFSDLSHTGYSFDEFHGNFNLANGLMSTENSFINGPIAYASMKGDLDIGKQLYNLDLKVSPHVTASLPIVATIAGGPVAGIATWVVSKIINQGVQKISGYTYKISGPWKQPIVQQVSIIKQKK